MVGMLSDPQHPAGIAVEPEAGQVDHVDRVTPGQPGGQRHQVAVGDGQAVDEDQRRGVAGAADRGAVMGRDAADRPPAALEPLGRSGRTGRQPIPVQGRNQGPRRAERGRHGWRSSPSDQGSTS